MKNQLINLIFSIVIFPLKVLNVSNRGSLLILSPLAFAEGLFIFINIFIKKKDFYSILSKLIIWININLIKKGKV